MTCEGKETSTFNNHRIYKKKAIFCKNQSLLTDKEIEAFQKNVVSKIVCFVTSRRGLRLKKVRRIKADSHIACRAHSVPLPCRAAKGLECVFPIDLHSSAVSDSHLPCHAPTMPFFSRPQHSTAVLCCGLEKNGMVGAWHGHGMSSVNQTRPHCVDQMGKTHSKPLAAQHDRGTACYV